MPANLNQPPEQAHSDTGSDSIRVLYDLAESLGGRVRTKRVGLDGGITTTRELRALYRGHKIELLADDKLICADIEARYGRFELLKTNRRPTRFPYGEPACTINTTSAKHVVFTIDGSLSGPQSELYESRVLERLLDVIEPQAGEEINISQRLVRVYLQESNLGRAIRVINAVIDLMPHDTAERTTAEFDTLPDALRPLVPLMEKWAIQDDEERSRKLRRCARSTRQKLADTVVPLLPAIDQFLDTFGPNPPEEACALGDLAQAALEAQSLLSIAPEAGRPHHRK